jgi:branched-chain amino acid transport system permease protein
VRARTLAATGARRAWPVVAVAVPTVAIVLYGYGASDVLQRQITVMLMNMVLVVGLYVFAGNSGVLSFGHTSFTAIGAYVTALLTIPVFQKDVLLTRLPEWLRHAHVGAVPAMAAAGAVAAVFAAVIGIPLMRLNGIAASLGLFAVLVIVHNVAQHWEHVTRGTLTMLGVPTDTTMTRALLVALGAIVVAYVFQESKVGLRLRASREDEVTARSIGVNVTRDRWIALVISAFVVGVGGFLWAEFYGSFNPDVFYVQVTFITIAMLVVGGLHSLAGAVYGTIVVSAVAELLRRVEEGWAIDGWTIPHKGGMREVGLAILLLAILIFRPKGLTGGNEVGWPRPRRLARTLRRAPAAASGD